MRDPLTQESLYSLLLPLLVLECVDWIEESHYSFGGYHFQSPFSLLCSLSLSLSLSLVHPLLLLPLSYLSHSLFSLLLFALLFFSLLHFALRQNHALLSHTRSLSFFHLHSHRLLKRLSERLPLPLLFTTTTLLFFLVTGFLLLVLLFFCWQSVADSLCSLGSLFGLESVLLSSGECFDVHFNI